MSSVPRRRLRMVATVVAATVASTLSPVPPSGPVAAQAPPASETGLWIVQLTTPSVAAAQAPTGTVDVTTPSAQAHLDLLAVEQAEVADLLSEELGRPVDVEASYRNVLNAIVIEADPAEVPVIAGGARRGRGRAGRGVRADHRRQPRPDRLRRDLGRRHRPGAGHPRRGRGRRHPRQRDQRVPPVLRRHRRRGVHAHQPVRRLPRRLRPGAPEPRPDLQRQARRRVRASCPGTPPATPTATAATPPRPPPGTGTT